MMWIQVISEFIKQQNNCKIIVTGYVWDVKLSTIFDIAISVKIQSGTREKSGVNEYIRLRKAMGSDMC